MSEYEQILRQLGSFGPYQRRAFILVSMFETPLAWAMLTPMLLNIKPDWFCYDWGGLQKSLLAKNLTDPSYIRGIDSVEELRTYLYLTNTSNTTLSRVKNVCPNDNMCPEIAFEEGISSIVTQVMLSVMVCCWFRFLDYIYTQGFHRLLNYRGILYCNCLDFMNFRLIYTSF